MRRTMWVCVFVLLVASQAAAQDEHHRAEFGILYEHLGVKSHPLSEDRSFGLDGINIGVAWYLTSWVAVKGEVGGQWGRPFDVLTSMYSYLFGLQVAWQNPTPWLPWAHFLVGAHRFKFDVDIPGAFSIRENTLAMVTGGGLDVRFRRWLAYRPIEVSHVFTTFGDESQNNWRLKSGLILRF